MQHLDEFKVFVKEAKDGGGKVLVHCVAGVNRSGALAVAEVMIGERCGVLEAVRRTRWARGNFCVVNGGFQTELIHLARREGLLDREK